MKIIKNFFRKIEDPDGGNSREFHEEVHFNKLASKYDEKYGYNNLFTQYKIEKKINEFVQFIRSNNPKENLVILEIGCGTGEYTQKIAKKFPKSKLMALDISKKIIEIAKYKCQRFKNVEFIVKSAYATGLEDNSVDVVCGFYVLHHLDLSIAVKEIVRILKPKGLAFFYEPNILNPLVFLIKSNKFLKMRVGDSPDEWAINPLTISRYFSNFKMIKNYTSEFILPLRFIPFKWLKFLDKITLLCRFLPIISYLGGSVVLGFQKNRKNEI
jgi:ubiquinone/menaquinone biosynthesis C-methylase UbiE